MLRHISLVIFAAALPGILHAQSPQTDAKAASPAAMTDSSYQLGTDDEVEVVTFGQPDLTVKTRIKADGTIIMPFLGAVRAAGLTTGQLSRQISQAYMAGGYFSNPSVNVEVTSYASKTATVLGLVPNAGIFPLDRPYTVSDLVARAGGVRDGGANAVVLRPGDGSAEVRIALDGSSGDPSRIVQSKDILYVPPAPKVYVSGQVNSPKGYELLPGMTFRQALSEAGGPTVAGSTKRFEIIRNGKKIDASLDDLAQPGDILKIKEKLF